MNSVYRPLDLDGLGASSSNAVYLEDEVMLDKGISSALKLAVTKGFVETEVARSHGRTVKDTSILAKNYSIEDKKHE